MEINTTSLPAEDALHIFVTATDNANVGVAIIDNTGKVWFWNRWLEERSELSAEAVTGKAFLALFPDLANGRLASSIDAALKHGLTSLLSQSLNKSPLPLFENPSDRSVRLQQAIHVTPIECKNQIRFCLVQVTDVSVTVRKESLLKDQTEKLHGMAYIDGLTGIPNRRHMDEYFSDEIKRAARNGTSLSIIMLDIDFFKQYNDTYGHQAGDFCLQRIANTIRASLRRPADLVARYGGEEFVIVLPDTPVSGASSLADDIARHVENLAIPHKTSKASEHITLSMGIAGVSPDNQTSGSSLLAQADIALYQAKKSGRNRTVIHQDAAQNPTPG